MSLSREEKRRARAKIMSDLRELEAKEKNGEKVAPEAYKELRSEFGKLSREPKITEDVIELAKKNDVSLALLKKRVYSRDIDPVEAATQKKKRHNRVPIDESGITPEIYIQRKKEKVPDTAIEHEFNVSQKSLIEFKRKHKLIMRRVEGGYVRLAPDEKYTPAITVSPETIQIAEYNGINKNTLYNRIFTLKWTHERASTEKVSYPRGARIGVQKSVFKNVECTMGGKFKARIGSDGLNYYGPVRMDEEQAAEDADILRLIHGGNLNRLNFPKKVEAFKKRIAEAAQTNN